MMAKGIGIFTLRDVGWDTHFFLRNSSFSIVSVEYNQLIIFPEP